MNNIERWGLTQTPVYETPKELPSGELTQQFHVQGRYFAALNLSAYPLDRHELPISIEDTAADSSQQVYVFDEDQSGLDPAVRLPGWNIDGTRMRIDTHRYGTSFGESADRAGSDFSRATFAIAIDRPVNFFVWKLMLPLGIVMLVAISVLMVHPSLAEIRIGAPATALLALVFLQQAYSGTLPENGNLVLLDKIYAVSYGLIVALIATTILTSYRTRTDEEVDHAKLIRIDRWVAGVLAGTFVGASALLIALG